VRVHLKGVHSVDKKLADGTIKTFHYHRATRTPLTGLPGSPEFIASFAAAEKVVSDSHHGTFNALVYDYTTSIDFQNLAESTKKEYRRLLTTAEAEFGTMPIGLLNDPRVRQDFTDWRDKVAIKSGKREADIRVQVISAMISWAINRGKLSVNHLKGLKRLHHADRSQMIWLPEHITAFMKVAPVEMQQALTLALNTGQREGDLLHLPWSAYDGKTIRLRQGKTGMPVLIPCTAELRSMLDGMERKAITILTTNRGRPFKKSHFINCWTRAMEAAGIEGLHFHDLRGTCVTRLTEAGCTVQEVAAITGHKLATAHQIIQKYLARTAPVAHQAIAKLENTNRTNSVNRAVNQNSAKLKIVE